MDAPPPQNSIAFMVGKVRSEILRAWRLMLEKGPDKVQFWFIALLVGIAAGSAAVLFRLGVNWLQSTFYGTDDPHLLHSFAQTLPWYWIVAIPVLGGLAVGLILNRFSKDQRAKSVAEVIEGAALHDGRVVVRAGLASAAA
jgi:CIC family chloride channel protein